MPDPEFILLGDAIWIDFVNTARGTGTVRDRLADPADYHRWIKAEKLASDADAVSFEDVRRFRDRLSALATALADGHQAPAAAIQAVNAILATTTGYHHLTRVRGAWRTQFTPLRPATALDAIARSAAATLSDPNAVVRQCVGPRCTLFLVDSSPGRSRRWCGAACGQKVRVERRRSSR